MKKNVKIGLFYLAIAALTFWKYPFTFFQQDEWALSGYLTYWDKANLSWFERLFTYEHYTHLIPFSDFLSYIQFKLLGLNFFGYAIFGVGLHLANAYLVYTFSRILLKNNITSSLVGLFFLTNSVSHQAITWTITTIGTAGSTFFVISSLIFFVKYLEKSGKLKFLYLCLLSLFIALGFKETSTFLFIFLPIFLLIWKGNFISFKKLIFPLGILAFSYFSFRVFFYFVNFFPQQNISELSQPSFYVYLFRLFSLPIKFMVESIVPISIIIKISKIVVRSGYSQFILVDGSVNPFIVESVGADIVILAFAVFLIAIIGILIYLLKRKKEYLLSKGILVSFIFIALSSIPFILVPGRAGFITLLDGRHLYITSIFTALLLAIFIYSVYKFLPKKMMGRILALILVFAIVSFNEVKIFKDLSRQEEISSTRKKILHSITSSYPKLPKKVIFYIESDKSYYGLPKEEKIPPFQSGLGQTLLVWYNVAGESFPACFYKGEYLYELIAQGYKECGGRGFGYFRKKDTLISYVRKNDIPVENIIGFSYSSSEDLLKDITANIRKDLQTE